MTFHELIFYVKRHELVVAITVPQLWFHNHDFIITILLSPSHSIVMVLRFYSTIPWSHSIVMVLRFYSTIPWYHFTIPLMIAVLLSHSWLLSCYPTHDPISPSTHDPISPSTHDPISPSTHDRCLVIPLIIVVLLSPHDFYIIPELLSCHPTHNCYHNPNIVITRCKITKDNSGCIKIMILDCPSDETRVHIWDINFGYPIAHCESPCDLFILLR